MSDVVTPFSFASEPWEGTGVRWATEPAPWLVAIDNDVARALGRKWAEDEAAAGHLMFAPTSAAAMSMVEDRVRELHRALGEVVAEAARQRRDELLAEHASAKGAEEAAAEETARAASDAASDQAHAEWLERQAVAGAEKRARQEAPPPAPVQPPPAAPFERQFGRAAVRAASPETTTTTNEETDNG